MLLEGRNAVIYGGGGSIGGAVARAFAREGATVHLAGRTRETLEAVAEAPPPRRARRARLSRRMMPQGSGVILVFGGYGDPLRDHNLGGLQVAFGAQEYLRRNLAAELGPYGIRALTIQTGGVPDSIPDDFAGKDAIARSIVAPTLLGRAASLEDVGNVAAFAASDWARTITGSALNIICGTEIS